MWSLNGNGDFQAELFSGEDWSGLYKTSPGDATLFIPISQLTEANLYNLTFNGVFFNTGDTGNTSNVEVTSNGSGNLVFRRFPFSNVSSDTLSAQTDTITTSGVNNPFNGAMLATVTRGAGSGQVACLANAGGGMDGFLVACAGTDPSNNALPYGIMFSSKASAGSIDTTFNGTGYAFIQPSTDATPASVITAVTIDSAGNIAFTGYEDDSSGYQTFTIGRLTETGAMDTSFNTTGYLNYQFSPDVATPTSVGGPIAIDSEDRIIAAASAFDASGNYEMVLARFTTNGALDTTFNSTGYRFAQFSEYSSGLYTSPTGVALDASGRIVIAGNTVDSNDHDLLFVARYTTAGALDTTFNGTGEILSQFSTAGTPQSLVSSLTLDAAGKIVVVGYMLSPSSEDCNLLARYTSAELSTLPSMALAMS